MGDFGIAAIYHRYVTNKSSPFQKEATAEFNKHPKICALVKKLEENDMFCKYLEIRDKNWTG